MYFFSNSPVTKRFGTTFAGVRFEETHQSNDASQMWSERLFSRDPHGEEDAAHFAWWRKMKIQ